MILTVGECISCIKLILAKLKSYFDNGFLCDNGSWHSLLLGYLYSITLLGALGHHVSFMSSHVCQVEAMLNVLHVSDCCQVNKNKKNKKHATH